MGTRLKLQITSAPAWRRWGNSRMRRAVGLSIGTGAAQRVVSAFAGEVPRTMEEMLTIPGAARKTANVVLGTAYGIPSDVVVDTHVQRLSARLDLTKNTDPVKIEQDLIKIIPREKWILFAHQMILHGRGPCQARNPKCAECGLSGLCYAKDRTA